MINVKYFGGCEVNFRKEDELEAYLKTHCVDEKGFNFFKEIQGAFEFQIESGHPIKMFSHAFGRVEPFDADVDFKETTWVENKVFVLKKNINGNHRIGGKLPGELVLPKSNDSMTPFQYIGTIDCSDDYFKWMGIPQFHIVYPIYECNFGIYLDYTDPQQPKFISGEFDSAWYDETMENMSLTEFSPTYFSATEEFEVSDYEGFADCILCGVPLWYQGPNIPRCPITNNVMKFVCSVNSDREIEVVNKRDTVGLPFSDEFLCFGDYGNLFVFYEPDTKIAHLNWQW